MAKAKVIEIKDMTLEQKMKRKAACEKYDLDPDDVVLVGKPGKNGIFMIRPDEPDEQLRVQMIAKGWAKKADEITDELIEEYLDALEDDDEEALERAKAGLAARRGW